MKVSRILIINVAIEQIHNNLQHGLEKTYFFASLAAKETKTLCIHCLFLLKLGSGLPR
jgi:hypothetical protein